MKKKVLRALIREMINECLCQIKECPHCEGEHQNEAYDETPKSKKPGYRDDLCYSCQKNPKPAGGGLCKKCEEKHQRGIDAGEEHSQRRGGDTY